MTDTAPNAEVPGNSFISRMGDSIGSGFDRLFSNVLPNWVGSELQSAMTPQTFSPSFNANAAGVNTTGGYYAIGAGGAYTAGATKSHYGAPSSGNNFNGYGTLEAAIKARAYPTDDPEWTAIARTFGVQPVKAMDTNTLLMLAAGAVVVIALLK